MGETNVKGRRKEIMITIEKRNLITIFRLLCKFLTILSLPNEETEIGTHGGCFVGEIQKDPFAWAHTEDDGSTSGGWG